MTISSVAGRCSRVKRTCKFGDLTEGAQMAGRSLRSSEGLRPIARSDFVAAAYTIARIDSGDEEQGCGHQFFAPTDRGSAVEGKPIKPANGKLGKGVAYPASHLLPAVDFACGDVGGLHQVAAVGQPVMTTDHGMPISDEHNSLKASRAVRSCLRSRTARDDLPLRHRAYPKRVVHARGAAAHGVFELTHSPRRIHHAAGAVRYQPANAGVRSLLDRCRRPRLVRPRARRLRLRGQDVHARGQLGPCRR